MYKRGEYIYIIILVGLAVSPLHGYDMKPFIARFDSPSTFLGLEYCPNDQALLIIKHESQQSRYNNPESGTHSSFRLIKKKKRFDSARSHFDIACTLRENKSAFLPVFREKVLRATLPGQGATVCGRVKASSTKSP